MKTTHELDTLWQPVFRGLLETHALSDAAHDTGHIRRVVANARRLTREEGADWKIVMPAAWLHDCVVVPKSSPDRKKASVMAARQAVRWLEEVSWPYRNLDEIGHAIEAHSFSAAIPTRTVEAKVLQDADRLDALGAVGAARTLMLGAEMKREFYHLEDPFCSHRQPDDGVYTLDHFYSKLLTLEGTMQTESGKREAVSRTAFLRAFLKQLDVEVTDA